MNKPTASTLRAGLAGIAVLALAGCGGGDSNSLPPPMPPPPTAEVPASASASPAGWIAYLEALVAAPADALEPVSVDQVTPPVSETTEPEPVS
ncbi:MAG: hypothetical protein KGN16_13015 [Burkholderiales bacterium]|nr:hypothetical protein [Burkholderiales bacterium]